MIPRPTILHARRGNALLLVSGLLVMLTLIAAAYLSRSRTQRVTAAAVHDTAADATRANLIAQQLAADVSQHLFLRPIDPNSAGAGIVGGNSSAARKPTSPFEMRFGIEGASSFVGGNGRGDMLSSGLTPRNPLDIVTTTGLAGDGWPDGFNFAPYAVVPWTNWPDHLKPVDLDTGGNPATNRFYPYLAPLNITLGVPAADTVASNPLGNPGFGDTRWLRSTEPVRMTQWTLKNGGAPSPVPDGSFFSHWAHLSFPASANNGWRVVPDISDIEGHARTFGETNGFKYVNPTNVNFLGGALSDDMSSERDGLGTPYEQWLPHLRPTPIPTANNAQPLDNDQTFVAQFAARRNGWFQRTNFLTVMNRGTQASMLPNLFKLDDPLGLGRSIDPAAVPVPRSDEFVENSPRNIVARTFADADGDGWTDSFWFLVPAGQEKNVRTVVGVSIVDNGGMLDLNVATRADRHTTVGFTPADLALVTSEPEGADMGAAERSLMAELGSAPWTDTRVGLLDSPRNFTRGRYAAGDPKATAGANPSGTDAPLYDLTGFEQAFDPYRWAGRPTPQIPGQLKNGVSLPLITDGEPTLLSSLGLWYDAGDPARPELNFWNGYLHSEPRSALRDPLNSNAPTTSADLQLSTLHGALVKGPWRAAAPPGTPARWQQTEPLFATIFQGQDAGLQQSWRWESWIDGSFLGLNSAPNPNGRYLGSPFMRPEERARWFRHAVTGELRAYGPFRFGADVLDASELLVPSGTVPREFLGESIRTRPFDTTDELELRAFGGLNDPGNFSRLERALNGESLSRDSSRINDTLLRSTSLRGESGVAGAQLSNAQWLKDLRRKMTVVSGQRNELMPAHLWVGRAYLAESRAFPNRWETFQNATLWLDLHPQVPGPVDEDGDGVISTTELQWGSYDLMRVTTSDDPFPDGIKITRGNPPTLSPSDWSRGVSIFENLNRKFDLRRPLVNQRRLEQWDLEQLPAAGASAKPFINEYGLVDETGRPRMAYAYSVQEQRRAMIDFAVNARQRLRPALRTVSPQRQRTRDADPYLATLNALGPRQARTSVDGVVNVAYASYTDRFLDQLRLTMTARLAGSVTPAERAFTTLRDETQANRPYRHDGSADLAELAWRSAWSTEALTASLAANLATWRSRPDLIRESIPFSFVWPGKLGWGIGDLSLRYGADVPLRPVWQPILPWFESGAAHAKPDGNPYFQVSGTVDASGLPAEFLKTNHRPDYGDSPVRGDATRKMREFATAQAIRAVDPARPAAEIPNAGVPGGNAVEPDENTADLVFPGNEKHPFLTETFFSWVYPATTFDDPGTSKLSMPNGGWGLYKRYPHDLPFPSPDQFDGTTDTNLRQIERTALTTAKYVGVVTGQVGAPRLVADFTDPRNNPLDTNLNDELRRSLVPTAIAFDWSRGLWKPSPTSTPGSPTRNGAVWIPDGVGDFDPRRDELNEIRTPVLVVQVANPWNEPIRLGDFRLNIFGNLYDFPDHELDENGQPVRDAFGVPVPLMLPPATELQPATATVYLIADVVGNEGNDLMGLAERIDAERVEQSDLADVAMYDPLFRRRWLDYLDLYEYADGATLKDVNGNPLSRAVTSVVRPARDLSTSPRTSCLYAGPVGTADALEQLPRSKLLNAMDRSDDALAGTLTKRRIDDLWKFKNSLTPDAMRQGITLERILRDPSGRNGSVAGAGTWQNRTVVATNDFFNRFQRTGPAPGESTIDRYRLRFWPTSPSATVFPRDSRAPESVFPPRLTRTTTSPAQRLTQPQPNLAPIVEPTTLVVDRFDADDDFNHWSTVVNARLGFESARGDPGQVTQVAVDPFKNMPLTQLSFLGTPLPRPENRQTRFFENPYLNQDRNLVTGGRFWTACAQITMPPTRTRWPDGRDRRMVPYPADWDFQPAGQANVGSDSFWHDWTNLPSAPVMLGSTMMTNDGPSPVMLAHFLSRIETRTDMTGAASYRLGIADQAFRSSIAKGEGEWFAASRILDPANPGNGFDFNTPRGQLDAQELAAICQVFPHLDRDRNQIPDEVQKVFIGFDEPEGSIYSFPPAVPKSLNGNVTFYQFNPLPVDLDVAGESKPWYPPVRGWPYSGGEAAFGVDGVDRTPGYRGNLSPGINLRTATESRDYFLTWTRVSRSWSRLFDARLATRQVAGQPLPPTTSDFDGWQTLQRPGSLLARQADITGSGGITGRRATYRGTSGDPSASLQGNEVANRPMWEWTRQVVNTSANGDASGIPFSQAASGVPEGVDPAQTSPSQLLDRDGNIRPRLGITGNGSSWLVDGVNLTAWFGAFTADRLAPRFVFANRTEPDRCDRPVDMRITQGRLSPALQRRADSRPIRQELIGYQCGRYPASFIGRAGYKGETGSPLVDGNVISRSGLALYRAPKGALFVRSPEQGGLGSSPRESYQWIAANDGELLTALGDTFAMEPPLDPANAEDATRRPRDPDVWAPDPIDPGRTVANATAIENELRWMDNVRSFNWLTRPVVAPLPDLQGLGWSAGSGTRTDRMASVPDAEDALPTAAFPELVMRKPTAFNCQTVIDDRLSRDMPSSVLPYTGDSKDFGAGAPIPAYRRFLYAKYADFIPQVDSGGVLKERVDGTTRFLYPPWARPAGRAGQFAATSADSYTLRSDPIQVDLDGNGTLDDVHYGMDLYPERSTGRLSIYRVYMGDKGGRLVDHQGRNLVIDLVTMRPALHDGDIISGLRNQANGSTDDAGYPLAEMQRRLGLGQWRMQGVWNTLDRIPHGESLQMLHKDDDFEQLGELADVFLWGPAYRVYRNPQTSVTASAAEWSPYNPDGTLNGRLARGGWLRPTDLQTTTDYNATSVGTGIAYDPVAGGSQPAAQLIPPRLVSQCRATFAEIMTGRVPGFPVGEGPMVNRLQVDPPNIAFHQPATGDPYATATGWGAPQQYGGTSALAMPYAPNVPWGMRVFDAFTLDGPGGVLRYDWSDQFAGRTIDMNPSSSPSPGSITATTGAAGTNVLPFETATGAPGNPFFNPSVQDGAPSTTGLTHRMTAARPAGALIPLDAYRDARVVDNVGRVAPSVTRASLAQWEHDRTPSLSGGFRGLPVPGLLNVNTATVEALRSLPHLNQMVYDDSGRYRIGGSPQFELHGTARESPYSLGLAGTLPAASGISSLNTDGQFRSLAANLGDRGPNPTSKLPEAMSIYRDGLNPNTLLAASTAAATVTDWYVREFTDPMKPAAGGSAARPDSTATVSVPSSFPIYPSYVDRGEAAGTPALVGTGLTATGVDETGSRRDPFHFVHYNRGMRATPGFGTIGEIMGLGRTTRTKLNGDGSPTVLPAVPGFALFPDWQYDQSWSVRLAGLDPYRSKRFDPTSGQGWQSYVADPDGQSTPDPLDARLSTDRQSVRTFDFSTADRRNNVSDAVGADGLRDLTVNDAFRVEPDAVAGDSEERNLLFKGVSNLVSTRSDVFTAYFRVKTVKQGPDGRWNAMDPETLLSEGRYVMCIDRSKVNRPTDKPRIVYFTKVQD